jgi:L-aminopeptidase/D-esterase-like protein
MAASTPLSATFAALAGDVRLDLAQAVQVAMEAALGFRVVHPRKVQRGDTRVEAASGAEDFELLLQRDHLVQPAVLLARAGRWRESQVQHFLQAADVDVVLLHKHAHGSHSSKLMKSCVR